MISKNRYITLSLELHLFYARLMKEHLIFLQVGFTSKNKELIKEADSYKTDFEKLLLEVVKLSKGWVSKEVLDSGEVVTCYTLETEKKTNYYTGIEINTKITSLENNLSSGIQNKNNSKIFKSVKSINCKIIKLLERILVFKTKILEEVLCCNLFTMNYPLLLEHIIEEAKVYYGYLNDLEGEKDITNQRIKESELFWDEIMREHALFIKGLLDPKEGELIETADRFADRFAELIEKADSTLEITMDSITIDTLQQTINFREFKKAAINGAEECKIRSIILPLLADHVLREANHYIRLLDSWKI